MWWDLFKHSCWWVFGCLPDFSFTHHVSIKTLRVWDFLFHPLCLKIPFLAVRWLGQRAAHISNCAVVVGLSLRCCPLSALSRASPTTLPHPSKAWAFVSLEGSWVYFYFGFFKWTRLSVFLIFKDSGFCFVHCLWTVVEASTFSIRGRGLHLAWCSWVLKNSAPYRPHFPLCYLFFDLGVFAVWLFILLQSNSITLFVLLSPY